jgi:hypothetical protein
MFMNISQKHLSLSSGLNWECLEVDSLYMVRRRARLGRTGRPEFRFKEIVWANRKSSCRAKERGPESGEKNWHFWGPEGGIQSQVRGCGWSPRKSFRNLKLD